MFSRILAGAISMLVGVIVIAVSAASAAAADDDPGEDGASSPLPELVVAPPTDYPDVRLFNGYAFSGQAAFDPADPRRLVVGIQSGTGCYVKASADGGRRWGALVPLPQLMEASCRYSPPAVVYAAGGRLYAAYAYTKPSPYCGDLSGAAVNVSTDQGATWSIPTSALPEGGTCEDDGYGDVRLAAAPDGPSVYVAANWRGYHATQTLLFSSSGNHGASWTPGKQIVRGAPDSEGTWLRGFALAAGRGGSVLFAYGWEEDAYKKVGRSADRGASFIYGTADQYSTADPNDGSLVLLDPDIKIGKSGTAHLAYAKGFNPGTTILYKYSFAPYGNWSAAPVRLDDEIPQAALYAPHLAVGACGQASVLHASWLESLDASEFPKKVLYTRRVAQPGYTWSEPLKVGTLKNGIYESGLAAAGTKAFSVFSGRTAPDPQNKWGIAGSRVSSGVTCP